MDILGRLKAEGLPVVAIEGNHDKAYRADGLSWMSFLSHQGYLHLLKPAVAEGEWTLPPWDESTREGAWLELSGARLYGLGYPGAAAGLRLQSLAPQIDPGEFTIALLHAGAGMGAALGIGAVSHEDLAPLREKVDYLALGHLHAQNVLDDWAYMPGAPEYWQLDEADYEKCFFDVTVTEDVKNVVPVPSTRRPAYRWRVDVSGAAGPEEVLARVDEFLSTQPVDPSSAPLVKLILHGEIGFDSVQVDLAAVRTLLQERFSPLVVEVLNDTNLPTLQHEGKRAYLDRATIERQVLEELIGRDPAYRDRAGSGADLVLRLKGDALRGATVEDLVDEVRRVVREKAA